MSRPQMSVSPIPGTLATPGNVLSNAVPPNQAMFASGVCVAQNPWVRVTPVRAVFSNTHVTVSPTFRSIVTVCVFRSPVPVLPPPPVTVQAFGVLGFVDPPMPVRTHPLSANSCTV